MIEGYAFTWRERDGTLSRFEASAEKGAALPLATAEALARRAGWPGHQGESVDYLLDDARRLVSVVKRMTGG